VTNRRVLIGAGVAVVGLVALTTVLIQSGANLTLASVVLLYLVVVVAVAVFGGLVLALAAAVASDLVVNFYFVPPYHTFSVASPDHAITLVVYVAVAATVSVATDVAARLRVAAARRGIEAALLARITADPIGERSLAYLLEHIRATLQMDSAAVVDGSGQVVAVAGRDPGPTPTLSVPAGDDLRLVLDGPDLFAPDPRFLRQLATAAARAAQAQRLAADAAQARELAEVDRLRAALLAAVGHDLRTPLAGIKAGVSSLRDPELPLTAAQRAELLSTVDESTDRMSALVENLLALSRLQSGALSVAARPVALDEVVAAALLHLAAPGAVELDVPDDLPLAMADPGLLERVVANVVANALRASPSTVRIVGRHHPPYLELQFIDHGPGVGAPDRDRMFAPFQRLDDHGAGLGLGLAIAKGFTEAMHGTIQAGDTPGGGLTMTVTVPVAP